MDAFLCLGTGDSRGHRMLWVCPSVCIRPFSSCEPDGTNNELEPRINIEEIFVIGGQCHCELVKIFFSDNTMIHVLIIKIIDIILWHTRSKVNFTVTYSAKKKKNLLII